MGQKATKSANNGRHAPTDPKASTDKSALLADIDRKLGESRKEARKLQLVNNAWAPAYLLESLDEYEGEGSRNARADSNRSATRSVKVSLDRRSRGNTSFEAAAEGNGRNGGEDEEDDDDSQSALVYVMHAPANNTTEGKRVSKRASLRPSDAPFSTTPAPTTPLNVSSYSMVNSAVNLPPFVKSLDLCVLGRDLVGSKTKMGRAACQDEVNYFANGELVLFGLFDGHGPDGGIVSAMCAAELSSVVIDEQDYYLRNESSAMEALVNGMASLQRRLEEISPNKCDIDESGTTATLCLVTPNSVRVCNVGDSRLVGARKKKPAGGGPAEPHAYEAFVLSEDHVFALESEAARVEAYGGRVHPVVVNGEPVGPPRAWLPDEDSPGLMVSRSLGDRVGKRIGITAEPHTTTTPRGDLAFAVVASDGMWEVLSSSEAVGIVGSALLAVGKKNGGGGTANNNNNNNLAEVLILEARKRWNAAEKAVLDDLSCVVVVFAPSS